MDIEFLDDDQGDPAPSSPSGHPLYSSPDDGLRGAAPVPIATHITDADVHLGIALKILADRRVTTPGLGSIEFAVKGARELLRAAHPEVFRVSDRSGANEVSGPTKEDGTHAERDPKGDAQEEKPLTNT